MKKKILTFVLVTIFLVCACTFLVHAADDAVSSVNLSQRTASLGDTITVVVSLSGDVTSKSVMAQPVYDASVFEWVESHWIIGEMTLQNIDAAGNGVGAFSTDTDMRGELFSFSLKVKSNAKIGNTTIGCNIVIQNPNIPVSCGEATFTVTCDHNYSSWEKNDAGTHKHTCELCGNVETAAHNWDSGKVTQAANCKDTGVKTYTCIDCGETKEEVIPVTNTHKYGDWIKVNDDQHKHTCSVCGKEESTAHVWDNGQVTESATHMKEGTKAYTCTDCHATKTESIPKTVEHNFGPTWEKHNEAQHKRTCECGEVEYASHNWDSGKVTQEANCKNAGVKTYTCTDCGETKTETIAVTDHHDWGEWQKGTANQHKRICKICGKTEVSVHTWNSGTVTKAATCKDTGVRTYTCTVCGETKTETIAVTNTHTWGNYQKVNNSTHSRTCSVCGKSETVLHTWNSGATVTPASHNQTGLKVYTCTGCGATKNETLPKVDGHGFGDWEPYDETQHKHSCSCGEVEYANHNWNEGVMTTAPNCKDTGVKTYTCTDCGATKTEMVPIINEHTWSEWQKDTAEEHKRICTICGKVETAGHNFDDGKITKEPTANSEGEKTFTCADCGEAKIERIDPLPESETTAPVTTEKPEETSSLDPNGSDDGSESNHTVTIVVVSVLAVIALGVIIFVIIIRKKKAQE